MSSQAECIQECTESVTDPTQSLLCVAQCEDCPALCAGSAQRQQCEDDCEASNEASPIACQNRCDFKLPIERSQCRQKCLRLVPQFNDTVSCNAGLPGTPISNNATCPPGMHCPNLNPFNDTTFPQLCPPSPECFKARLFGQWCESQGKYEPEVCESSFYCPNPRDKFLCPSGHWCVRGSAAPRPCPLATYCPPGTIIGRYYGGVVICLLLDVALVAYFLLKLYRWDPARSRANLRDRPRGLLAKANPKQQQQQLLEQQDQLQLQDPGTPTTPPPDAIPEWNNRNKVQSPPSASGRPPSLATGAWALARRASFSLSSLSLSSPGKAAGSSVVVDPLEAAVLASAKAILNESFRRSNGALSIRIDFDQLSLTLPPPASKTILSSVTGSILPSRVTAIMGPSGAGKTTFLSVLLGSGPLKRTAGVVRINGEEADLSSLGRLTGFVPQEDVMLRELSVRENIAHSARIRLPRVGWSAADINSHVDAVIEVLGLRQCADTATDRISGGQRKRVNIGMELALAPAAIFLDEPTSGLDSTAALQVCSTLKNIAELGVTVVAVIHQPRLDIFKSFDDLLLLAPGGKTVYAGPQRGVMPYFQGLGLEFSEGGNPADDVLDFVAGAQQLKVAPAVAAASAAAAAAISAQSTPLRDGGVAVANPLQAAASGAPDAGADGGDVEGGGAVALVGKEVANYLAWTWKTKGQAVAAAEAAAAATSSTAPPPPPPSPQPP